MSGPQDFLTRWSRRKQEAAAAVKEEKEAAPLPGEPEHAAKDEQASTAIEPGVGPSEPLFDPKSLPPIESITAETDIRAFLAPGVPAELARAALRRVWATDPKIRDFVGLADYAWDFNAAGSMHGFGTLEMTDELRRVVERLVGEPHDSGPSKAERSAEDAKSTKGVNDCDAVGHPRDAGHVSHVRSEPNVPVEAIGDSSGPPELVRRTQNQDATQHETRNPQDSAPGVRRERRHE